MATTKPICTHNNPWDDCAVCEFSDDPTTTEETISLAEQMRGLASSKRPTVNMRPISRPTQDEKKD